MQLPKLKSLIVILLLLSTTVIASGCWGAREFDSLALVKGVGIDKAKEEDRIKLTVQLFSAKTEGGESSSGGGGGGGGGGGVWTISATGYSIFEANRNLVKILGRRPFYSHAELIVFGEELAREEGIKNYMDYFNREPDIRRRAYIVISKGEAEEVLKAPHGLSSIPATTLKDIVNGQSISGAIVTSNMLEFTISLLSDTIAPTASKVELRKGGPKTEAQQQPSEKNLIFVNGGSIFKDDRLISWLNRKEARGLNWVRSPKEVLGPVLVQAPGTTRDIAIREIQSSSEITPQLKDGEFSVKLSITTEGSIVEDSVGEFNITKQENIKRLSKRYAQVIKNEIIAALKKSQQQQVDIFGFGERIRNEYPREFEKKEDNWNEIYAELPVKIIVETDIRRFGMIKKGLGSFK